MLIISDMNQMSPMRVNLCKGFPFLIGLQIKQYYMFPLGINVVILEKIRNITVVFSSYPFLSVICHMFVLLTMSECLKRVDAYLYQ